MWIKKLTVFLFNRNDIAEKIAQLALNSNHSLTKSKKKKEEIPYKIAFNLISLIGKTLEIIDKYIPRIY